MRADRSSGAEIIMSTHTSALKGHTVAAETFTTAVIDGFAAIKASLTARAERARVARELSAMSDRDLSDIGIGRADIMRVAGYEATPEMALAARR
jgi:uncharacterized protein YjiS (DUF1127 family)